MGKIRMRNEAGIDKGYEFYQTIIDFDHPIQIFREAFQNSIDEKATEVHCRVFEEKQLGKENLYIDIWDDGEGLNKKHIDCFFGLAKSTKVNKDKIPIAGKLGYKGHGTKIFFKAEKLEICSLTKSDTKPWGIILIDAIEQIRKGNNLKYSDILDEQKLSIKFPKEFKTGFYVRIKNPHYFKTQYTRFMLNHMYLRDYSKWYTVFGNIRAIFSDPKDTFLFLQGLNINHIKEKYNNFSAMDPIPEFSESKSFGVFEKIKSGHYFPPERCNEKQMEQYAKKVGQNKPYPHYYSKEIYKDKVYLDNNLSFDFAIYTEGYETKRRYDILLSKKGHSSIDKNLLHTDSERYGLWACKGGVPIEKIDDWIVGGHGIGTYTYMHAFVDCDSFELTGTRGSVRNTDLEILEKIRGKINEILGGKKIKNDLAEREEWEQFEKTLRTIDEDAIELKKRFKNSTNKKEITLPNKITLLEPSRNFRRYSESETLILLINLLNLYPKIFPFKLLDYNTSKGIDFVVENKAHPSFIELKGTLHSKINHSFRNMYKFICYDISLKQGDILEDLEGLKASLQINKNDKFESFDHSFKGKKFTSYQLVPSSSVIQSMEVINLKSILTEIIGATIK